MAEANAFALPGGHIYVSRGLLAIANSEDELANVIGHEIGHVAARHHARQQARAQQVGVASVLGTLAAAVLGGAEAAQVVGQLGQIAGAGYMASHSRDQERESDEIGQTLAAKGGWNPAGMAEFLATLGRETTLAARPGADAELPRHAPRDTGTCRERLGPRARAGARVAPLRSLATGPRSWPSSTGSSSTRIRPEVSSRARCSASPCSTSASAFPTTGARRTPRAPSPRSRPTSPG